MVITKSTIFWKENLSKSIPYENSSTYLDYLHNLLIYHLGLEIDLRGLLFSRDDEYNISMLEQASPSIIETLHNKMY